MVALCSLLFSDLGSLPRSPAGLRVRAVPVLVQHTLSLGRLLAPVGLEISGAHGVMPRQTVAVLVQPLDMLLLRLIVV